jgi:hypothetical protein
VFNENFSQKLAGGGDDESMGSDLSVDTMKDDVGETAFLSTKSCDRN